MEEVEVRETGVLSLLEGGVELLGRHGDTQRGEVGEGLITPVRRGRRVGLAVFLRTAHRRIPRVRVNADSRWSDAGRSIPRADWDRGILDAGQRVRRAMVWV